jgi:hypothetical protein
VLVYRLLRHVTMRITLLVVALACSCVDSSPSAPSDQGVAPPDLTTAAPDGSPPQTATCAESLDDYCAHEACIRDLKTAETSTAWCGDVANPYARAYYEQCDSDVLVAVAKGSISAWSMSTTQRRASYVQWSGT